MAQTVAGRFERTLAAAIRWIHDILGDSLNGPTDVIQHHREVNWIHVRQTEVGGFGVGTETYLTDQLVVSAVSHRRADEIVELGQSDPRQ